MPVPSNILDMLNSVQADADALATAKLAATQAAAALTAAQGDDQQAKAAVIAAQQHLATNLAALVTLEQQTYGTAVTP